MSGRVNGNVYFNYQGSGRETVHSDGRRQDLTKTAGYARPTPTLHAHNEPLQEHILGFWRNIKVGRVDAEGFGESEDAAELRYPPSALVFGEGVLWVSEASLIA